ncbi:alpha/beta hydrolase [Pseudodonghicola flavimaris]|uniref:Alpha/beta hydrolase n=1 Tax=Pseudodonghicola flavimaris TaxID=3050036 RepID=A0ABT7F2Y7_9RHOB|nr:alpha/beta hydrolase [Pseudodonghicola flavimaris]MDK3018962.1 alpha/beta hydrolase [Pseudodonghicola flavimaris]
MPVKSRLLIAIPLIAALGALPVPRTVEAEPVAPAADRTDLPPDPGFAALNQMITMDPDAALTRIGRLLEALQAEETSDPQVIFDLYAAAADLMIEGGAAAQAAQVLAQLADFAARFRLEVDHDPIPLYAQAAAMLEDTGQPEAAQEALLALLAEERAGGLAPAETAPTRAALVRIARALGRSEPEVPAAPATGPINRATILYATDRARGDSRRPQSFYGAGRGPLELGRAEVSLPVTAEERAVLRQVAPLSAEAFDSALAGAAAPDLLVVVPGYNSSFEQSARHAAQLARDLRLDGAVLLLSWASAGTRLGYLSDTATVRLSGRNLAHLLRQVAPRVAPGHLHLLAEGLGAQALADALELIGAGANPPPLGQVFFVTPDLDADLFRAMLPAIQPLAARVTLYTSDRSSALEVARPIYGPALRAGEGEAILLRAPGLDSIDVSALGRLPLRPEVVLEADGASRVAPETLVADIAALLWRNAPPAARCGLVAADDLAETGWRVTVGAPGACKDPAWPALLGALRRSGAATLPEAEAVLRRNITDPELRKKMQPAITRLLGE